MAVPDKLFSIPTVVQRGIDLYPELSRRWTDLQRYLQTFAADHTHSGGPDGDFIGVTTNIGTESRTFTNTSYLDLDALTGGSGSIDAEAITINAGADYIIFVGCRFSNSDVGAICSLSHRVSGATTSASSDILAFRYESGAANDVIQASWVQIRTGLTAGSNTFELQAKVSAGTGLIDQPIIIGWPVSRS